MMDTGHGFEMDFETGATAMFSRTPWIQRDSGLSVVLPMAASTLIMDRWPKEDAMSMKLQSLLQALRGCLDERTSVSGSHPQDDCL